MTLRYILFFAALTAIATSASARAQTQAVFRDCEKCPQMVAIPAGTALLGAAPGEAAREGLSDEEARGEGPQYRVRLALPIAVGKYEVTQAQYRAFVEATGRPDAPGCKTYDMAEGAHFLLRNDPTASWHDLRSSSFEQWEDGPAVCVSWDDAGAYAAWLSVRTRQHYRLPSQSEWEYAARGGTATSRYWGDGREDACRNANVADYSAAGRFAWSHDSQVHFHCGDGNRIAGIVGSYTANPFGLYDVLGNVSEWTLDCETATTAGIPGNGKPARKGNCARHVVRGSNFGEPPRFLRVGARAAADAGECSFLIGFRLVRELKN